MRRNETEKAGGLFRGGISSRRQPKALAPLPWEKTAAEQQEPTQWPVRATLTQFARNTNEEPYST